MSFASDEKDGGAAFPVPIHPSMLVESHGMTLRDYFAAKALQGTLSNFDAMKALKERASNTVPAVRIAALAYEMADAMLAERVK